MVLLFTTLLWLAFYVLALFAPTVGGILGWGAWGITYVPELAVLSRRVHDTGRSSWWAILLYLVTTSIALDYQGWRIPRGTTAFVCVALAAAVIYVLNLRLLFLLIRAGSAGANRFGPPPVPVANVSRS